MRAHLTHGENVVSQGEILPPPRAMVPPESRSKERCFRPTLCPERESLSNPCPRRENPTNPRPKRDNLTKTLSRAHILAMSHGSMHMERDLRLGMTHESMHALEVTISDIA